MPEPESTSADFRIGFEGLDLEVDDVALTVQGELPPWLNGTLIRNGAGRWTAGAHGAGESARHWFDGLAMLQRFSISAGQVRYTNRYVRSPAWREAQASGRFGYAEVGTTPSRSWPQRLARLGRPPVTGTNAVVNVLRLGGRHVAVTETPDAIPFDPLTLRTLDPIRYSDDLPGDWNCAHPHHDAERAELVSFCAEYGRHPRYHLYGLPDGSLARRLIATVPTDEICYLHSFALTPRFAVLIEYPLTIQPLSLLVGRSILDSFSWRPQRGLRFIVVDRSDGAVVTRSPAPATFCFHQVNAYEHDDQLVVDLPVMPGERAMSQFELSALRGHGSRQPAGELRRYRVPLDGGPVTYASLSTQPLEFPAIAYDQHAGRHYRYVYGVGTTDVLTTSFADRVVKVGVEDGRSTAWSKPGCYPGEPVLVPAPASGPTTEDAGVLLSLVLNAVARTSFLLVLDAADLSEIARVELPHRSPLGFHGQWYDGLSPEVGPDTGAGPGAITVSASGPTG